MHKNMPENNDRQVSFDDEMLIVVNEADEIIGYKDKLACHEGDGILHRAFSLFIFNRHGELLIQQRSSQKQLWPLIWANSCCSHPRKGEELETAIYRRLNEELGITTALEHLFTFQYHARFRDIGSEHEMCAVYAGYSDESITPNPNEVADWKYISRDALTAELEQNDQHYSPWLKLEWERILNSHLDQITAILQ